MPYLWRREGQGRLKVIVRRISFYLYTILLAVGMGLLGLVIGLALSPQATSVTSILLVVGILFIAGAFFIGRRILRS